MTQRGLVSFLVDPTTGVQAGAQFVAYLEALGVTHVKAPIRTASVGGLPTSLYVQAIQTHSQIRIPVLPLFDRAFSPVGGETQGIFPNAPLNGSGDKLTSDWIDGWTLRAAGFLRQLNRKCGTARAICWNEADLLSTDLQPGDNPDPAGLKSNALSPSVLAGLCWQAAQRWRKVGITDVYCGGLNIIPITGTDRGNKYVGKYLDQFYGSLEHYGCKPPWPWRGWSITAEGWWVAEHFAAEIAAIRAVMAAHGDTGEILCSEWGTTCHDLIAHPTLAAPTYAAITAACPEAYFFSGPGHVPFLGDPTQYGSYGAAMWRNQGGFFILGPDYAWGPTLRSLFAT